MAILILLGACAPVPEPEPKQPATPAMQTTIVSQQSESPTETAIQSTPTAAPESGCPVPPGSPPMPELNASFSWASELQEYLNQGGLVEPLAQALASTPTADESAANTVRRDLTGDGLEDLAFTLYQSSPDGQSSGSLLIFRCDKNRYRLAYSSAPGQNNGPPILVSVQDLNADGIAEILYTRETCGAHTCFKQVEVLRWNRSGFKNLFEGRSDDLPSPTIYLAGPQSDGTYRIEISAQGISSVGAGPYRQLTRVWEWSDDRSKFVFAGEQLAAPTYRIHLLHDADDAASAGNLEEALIMYQRVRENASLDDWIKGEAGFAELAAFATYRQMTIYVALDRTNAAQQAVQFLQEAVPQDDPAYGMRLLAEAYWQTYLETEDAQAACSNARRFAEQHPSQVLEPLQYGYANRTYTSADICLPVQ